jgi:hypothetical protein
MPRSVTTDFAPLDLSVDDPLPAHIELVMRYRGGIAAENVRRHFQTTSLLDARMRLGAWLCGALAERFPEVALWCDPRGLNGIPAF